VKTIYLPLLEILGNDIEKFKTFNTKYISSSHKNIFIFAHDTFKKVGKKFDFTNMHKDEKEMKRFLFFVTA
jgi:hypothetical protein